MQAAARNILGAQQQRFDAVPFLWSQHYDVTFNYAGHAERWDQIDIDGTPQSRNCAIRYRRGDRTVAMLTVGRDLANLQAERDWELAAAR